MRSPLTGPEQNALLDDLLVAARTDARSFAAQAALLVQLNDLAGREETELSRVAQFPVLELAGTLRQSQQALSARSAQAHRLVFSRPAPWRHWRPGSCWCRRPKHCWRPPGTPPHR